MNARRRWLLAVLAGVSLATLPLPLAAQSAPRLSPGLNWVRGPGAEGCMTASDLSARVEKQLGRAVFAVPADADVFVDGYVERTADGYRVTLEVSEPHGRVLGHRELAIGGDDCSGIDEPVSFVIALTLHSGLAQFEGRSSLKTWVSGICVRAASNYRRKAYRRRERAVAELEPEVAPSQHARIERREEVERLQRALQQLPATQREVFVLYEIDELPMREVASVVGCGRFTAYTRLRLARSAMQKLFAAELAAAGRKR